VTRRLRGIGLASQVVRLGFYMGYAPPGTNPRELIALAHEAERLGYDSAWAAEAWGTDAVTVLAWLAATTTTIKVGSAIMQIPGRTPTNTAMTAATLDLMSGGRFTLGLGAGYLKTEFFALGVDFDEFVSERELVELFRHSQPAWTAPEGAYGAR